MTNSFPYRPQTAITNSSPARQHPYHIPRYTGGWVCIASIRLWNNLPATVVSSPNIDAFPSRLALEFKFITPDTSRHHTFRKDAVASSGCQSRTIKSQHHAQDCPWRSSMLSYGDKLPLKIKKLNSLTSFKQAVRLYLIDRLVSEYNSDFLYH